MAITFCTSGQVAFKAGVNVNNTITQTQYETAINDAESWINTTLAIPGVNLVTQFSSLHTDVKNILRDVCSSKASYPIMNFNVGAYSTAQAQLMLNVNNAIVEDGMQTLRQKKSTDFMIEGF